MMKLDEIAEKIRAHLKRFEADPVINAINVWKTHPYYHANAYRAGSRVAVTYISYQHTSNLKREDALEYLAWLDAGNVGRHYAMEQQKQAPALHCEEEPE